MSRFLRHIKGHQITGSVADLEAQQAEFRTQQVSGLIEIEDDSSQLVLIVFARGTMAGTYLLAGESSTPVILAELPAIRQNRRLSLRSLVLTDPEARLLWLILNAQPPLVHEVPTQERWLDWLNANQAAQTSTIVEISSRESDRLMCMHAGQLLEDEGCSDTQQNTQEAIPALSTMLPFQIRLYKPSVSQAWQTFYLQMGASKWLHHLFVSYQRLVGQRLTWIAQQHITSALEGWDIKIHPESHKVVDRHFFPQIGLAAEVYRALLMNIGEQMSIVVGDRLAQRLLDRAFEQALPVEQAALQSQRLVPAAFTA